LKFEKKSSAQKIDFRHVHMKRGYDQQSSGGSSGPGSSSDIHLPSSPGVGGGLTDPSAEFRTRSSSWSTWAREALWKRRSQNQAPSRTRGLSESESTTPETDSSSSTPKKWINYRFGPAVCQAPPKVKLFFWGQLQQELCPTSAQPTD